MCPPARGSLADARRMIDDAHEGGKFTPVWLYSFGGVTLVPEVFREAPGAEPGGHRPPSPPLEHAAEAAGVGGLGLELNLSDAPAWGDRCRRRASNR